MGDNEKALTLPTGLEQAVATWSGQVDALVAEATAIKSITTDAQEAKASEVDQALGEKERAGDRVRVGYVEPFNQIVKRINALFNGGKDKIKVARSPLKGLIARRYQEKAAEAERLAQIERDRLAKNFKAQAARAEKSGREAPPPPPQVEAVVTKKVGTATVSLVWSYAISNINAIPAQFLEVRDGEVKRELARLEREGLPTVIPGIKAEKVPSVRS
jgi:hypothetical protein